MNEEEIKEYIRAKRTPVSSCVDLSKYFIGRHKVLPVYLTPQFEIEFNSKMCQLEQLKEQLQQKEEEYDRMFALWHSRKLIKKFDDEFDEEDKKANPNRNYVYVMPDAEEVYKRYYELKDKIEDLQKKNTYFERYLSEDFDILKKGIQYMIKKYIKSTVEMYVFKMNITDSYTVSLVYEGKSSSWDLYMPNIFDEKYMKVVAKGLCSNLSKITGKEEDYFFRVENS